MAFDIVSLAAAGGEHAAALASRDLDHGEDHPLWGAFGRRYYPLALVDPARTDASFAITESGAPLLVVRVSDGSPRLDWFGLPARMFVAQSAGASSAAACLSAALERCESLVTARGLECATLLDADSGPLLSPLGLACLGRGWRASVHLNGRCDLAGGEPGLRRALRKSFRSLVNWGRSNLAMTYVNAANPDPAAFADYRQFHRRVAGRDTRPEASWTAMLDTIASGGGELALGRLAGGELVAGTMVIDGRTTSYYSSGVYDRARFDKPMAHFPLYDAILRAGARGLRTFDLGDLPQAGAASAKELNIGYFKRGFASDIATALHWTWTPPSKERADLQ